ncbi:MAG TPA: alpha/beta fold hydrolase [Phycisphaerae bacterium]|nr:alpha/beta fold hydrolase [Phycisphaerae bacterium]
MASLRYDKSITAYPSEAGLSRRFTIDDEVTNDAVSALRVLARDEQVDPSRVYVLGHSLGGMMAPRIALRAEKTLAGVVLMAAPAESILDNGIQQTIYLASVRHTPEATLQAQLKSARDEQALLASHLHGPLPAEGYAGLPQSWWMSVHVYDQVTAAKALRVPMLIVQGGSDFQVSPRANFIRWQQAFPDDRRVTFKEYPGLSHLFAPAGNPPTPDDYAKPSSMDAQVIRDIARWINTHPAS